MPKTDFDPTSLTTDQLFELEARLANCTSDTQALKWSLVMCELSNRCREAA